MIPRHLHKLLLAAALFLAAAPVAQAADEVVVPKRVIYPGETVDASSLDMVRFRPHATTMREIAMTIDDASGKVAQRTLLPGRLIALNALRDAYAVEAGKPVAVSLVAGSLVISMTAVSLQSGSPGDEVRVRNAESGAIFSGRVLADGTIEVDGP